MKKGVKFGIPDGNYLIYYFFVIKDIVVNIAKIDNQELHGKMLNFALFKYYHIAGYFIGEIHSSLSSLFAGDKNKCNFFVVVGVALITLTKIILMNSFICISKL